MYIQYRVHVYVLYMYIIMLGKNCWHVCKWKAIKLNKEQYQGRGNADRKTWIFIYFFHQKSSSYILCDDDER